MARVATKLTPTKGGGFTARKRIPADVQSDYQRLFSVRWEARLTIKDGTPILSARAQHREWLTEIESRIANIRAERDGDGRSLTSKDARALSGEWYRWWLERQPEHPNALEQWEFFRDKINEALSDTLNLYRDPHDRQKQEIDDIWERCPEAREDVRPMLADWCETAQFLAARRLVLDSASQGLFLDALYADFGQALKLLIRNAKGDYTPDTWPLQFPRFEVNASTGLTPWQLFERWIAAKRPADSTVDRWRGVFLQLGRDFGERSAQSITTEEAQNWATHLVSDERTPITVRDIWVVAARTVFAWAKGLKLIPENTFAEVRVTVPRKHTTREKWFRADEVNTILNAASAITNTKRPSDAAKRWVPWVCAYTGARAGEITQLRGVDIVNQEGVDALRITPEAGTVKTKEARLVPLHAHLIEQGFLSFVASKGKGPLFYNQPKQKVNPGTSTNPTKPRYVKTREHLAKWVREIGVNDPNVKPNHAWRHTFMLIANRHGIDGRMSYYLTGHAQRDVGATYGAPSLSDKARALKQFPRYDLSIDPEIAPLWHEPTTKTSQLDQHDQ